jgi:hypothetical protein
MGFIDTSETLPVFYNVVQAVGKNCPNNRNDVLLVQYLLYWVYKNVIPPEAKPNGEMKIDGICGGITNNWILKFQLDVLYNGHSIQADNRIDRIRNKESFDGSLSGTVYTLGWLNWIVSYQEPGAFLQTAQYVPLQNPLNVPPPSNDVVAPPPPQMIPAVGGL